MKGFENLSQGLCQRQDKFHPSPGCSDGAVMFMGAIRSVNGLGGPSSYKPFAKDSQKNAGWSLRVCWKWDWDVSARIS